MTSSDDLVRQARAGIAGQSASKVPQRGIAVVTCMDARVDPLPALGLKPGDAHVLRNAGAIVTDDMLRSLLVSQHMLGTSAIDVMMHTDCGMQGLADNELNAAIAAAGSVSQLRFHGFSDLEAELRRGVERLRSAAALPARDHIRGLIYDVTMRIPRIVVS